MARIAAPPAQRDDGAPLRLQALPAAGLVGLVALILLGASAASLRAAPMRAIDVRYTGASHITTDSVLRATASARGARIAAVTFYLDGRPVGSDTTKPYALDLVGNAARAGTHRLRVVAVDSLGRRRASGTTVVRVRAGLPWLSASPTTGLSRALHALVRGGRVRLARGVYRLAQIRLGSGARLVGSGADTVISAPDGSYWSLLIASGSNIRVADLTLDGRGQGSGFGYGVEVQSGSADVRVQRVTMRHVRGAGLHTWGAYSQVSIQDSTITGDGTAQAGVIAGESGSYGKSRDTSVIRCRIAGFKSYGVMFAHLAHGVPDAALHAVALDNRITDINDPNRADGTNEGAVWSGGVEAAIIGNRIARTGWDGIETVGSSMDVAIVGNEIRDTPVGIYVEHETTSSLIRKNTIARVTTGINVEWTYGGVGSVANQFIENHISAASKTGIFLDVGSDRNQVLRNVLIVSQGPAIVLQGSSNNLVKGNRRCGSTASIVDERVGRWDNGELAHPNGNAIAGNTSLTRC